MVKKLSNELTLAIYDLFTSKLWRVKAILLPSSTLIKKKMNIKHIFDKSQST